jgi:hypothetical protein
MHRLGRLGFWVRCCNEFEMVKIFVRKSHVLKRTNSFSRFCALLIWSQDSRYNKYLNYLNYTYTSLSHFYEKTWWQFYNRFIYFAAFGYFLSDNGSVVQSAFCQWFLSSDMIFFLKIQNYRVEDSFWSNWNLKIKAILNRLVMADTYF